MEREKNLTKSFGIRVPLGMYLRMIEVSAERKLSITDICLYALSNSSLIGMANGGILLQSPSINNDEEISNLNNEIAHLKVALHKRTTELAELRNEHIKLLANAQKEVEDLKQEHKKAISGKKERIDYLENYLPSQDNAIDTQLWIYKLNGGKNHQARWRTENDAKMIITAFNDFLKDRGYPMVELKK